LLRRRFVASRAECSYTRMLRASAQAPSSSSAVISHIAVGALNVAAAGVLGTALKRVAQSHHPCRARRARSRSARRSSLCLTAKTRSRINIGRKYGRAVHREFRGAATKSLPQEFRGPDLASKFPSGSAVRIDFRIPWSRCDLSLILPAPDLRLGDRAVRYRDFIENSIREVSAAVIPATASRRYSNAFVSPLVFNISTVGLAFGSRAGFKCAFEALYRPYTGLFRTLIPALSTTLSRRRVNTSNTRRIPLISHTASL
jgi:hypothetical protein